MAKINVYYRAFNDYRKETLRDKSCAADRKKIKKSGLEFDQFRSIKYKCTIEEEWIKKIEEGLVFVEKAVAEERQFIRVNGEVVPIEKAKKISKHSVEHLAKHSNMITHVPEDPNANLVPDSIYMVEKLNDYAVYENRFLYMLLCYLRDFIALRLKNIYRLRMTYICDFSIKKNSESKNRNYQYETVYHDERFDNPYPIPDDTSAALLKRIEDCQQIILMLLNTDLMTEVAKSPMIKPPIVKTNVLKMDNNFKNSLALYDYIVTFKGDGYVSEEVVTDLVPFNDITADEMAELVFITRHLTFKYGNDIADLLAEEYNCEEELKRKEEEAKLIQQIQRLKKRVEETGKSLEEYILLLEKRNRMLESDSQELAIARNEIVKLNQVIEQLNQEKAELNRQIEKLQEIIEAKIREIAELHVKYQTEIKELKEKHAQEIDELNQKHALAIEELHNKYAIQIQGINQQHLKEIEDINVANKAKFDSIEKQHELAIYALKQEHNQEMVNFEAKYLEEHRVKALAYQDQISKLTSELNDVTAKYEEQTASYAKDVKDLNNQISEKNEEYDNKVNEYEKLMKELQSTHKAAMKEMEAKNKQFANDRNLAIAELDAIRVLNGSKTPSEEFTSKERFKELEKEFEAFNAFFKAQWAMTKKEIRKQLLWKKEDQKRKVKAAAKKENKKSE